MDWSADIEEQDIEVFLLEADELLQALSENFVRMEQEAANPELIQEMFRAAHTIKGSSGMLGFQRMADLAHAMESLLERVRQGEQAIDTPTVDALLHALDGLAALREELAGQEVPETDIRPYVEKLVRAAGGSFAPNTSPGIGAPQALTLGQSGHDRLSQLADLGLTAHRVEAVLETGCQWPGVRCFQIINELTHLGEVVASAPTLAQVEEGAAADRVIAVLASSADVESLRATLLAIEDVATVEAGEYSDVPGDSGEPAATRESGTDEGARSETGAKSAQTKTVRIDVERLDELMNALGELVVDKTRLAQIASSLGSPLRRRDHRRNGHLRHGGAAD